MNNEGEGILDQCEHKWTGVRKFFKIYFLNIALKNNNNEKIEFILMLNLHELVNTNKDFT